MNDTDSTKALIARPEELSLELCLDAYRMFADAESRANADQHAYAADVNGFHAEIKGLVKTNDQKRICDHEVERYRQGYLKRFQDYLHALSWCQAPEHGYRFDSEDQLWYKPINQAKPRQSREEAEELVFTVADMIRAEKGLPLKKEQSVAMKRIKSSALYDQVSTPLETTIGKNPIP